MDSECKRLGWERAGRIRGTEGTLRWLGSGKVREGVREQGGAMWEDLEGHGHGRRDRSKHNGSQLESFKRRNVTTALSF